MTDTLGASATPTAGRLREAVEPTLTQEERARIGRRIGSALVATALLIVGWIYGAAFPDQQDVAGLVLFVGAIIAAAPVLQAAIQGLGWPAHRPAVGELTHEHEGHEEETHHHEHNMMDQVVSVAVLAAIATGAYSTAILVPLFMAVGHFLEERSVLGAKAAIEGLKRLRARDATRLKQDGAEETVAIEQLNVADHVIVRPGEVFPADGRVIEGHSAVDQSAVTGESVPEDVSPGSPVFAGTVNLSGLLTVEVTELGDDTAMGKVLDTLKEAERSRAPITQLLERYAGYYMPFILITALITLLLSREVARAVAVLVVACPCALVLSSSTAIVAALALASRSGILIKNTRFLEVLSDVRTVVLDKTGTVTLGHLEVVGVRPLEEFSEADLVESALMCAHGSRHPISRAIVREADKRGIALPTPPEITEYPGKGVEARVNGVVLQLGNSSWLEVDDEAQRAVEEHVGPVVWAKRDGQLVGAVLMADRPRPEAREALKALRELGVSRTVLLTGDRAEVAQELADYLAVDEFQAGLLPAEKLRIVEEEAASGERVMAVGDGVNDAPALARADVGVAMGAMGSDAAIQSADIALMSNDIRRLGTAIRLSRLTRATINTNVAVGIGSAVLMITLAALGYVGAIAGALLHTVGAVAVVLNSGRLLRLELDEE